MCKGPEAGSLLRRVWSCLGTGWGWELKKDSLRPPSLAGSRPLSCRERNQILLMETGSPQGSTHMFLTW